MIWFWSCEETLALVGGFVVAGVAYKLFGASGRVSLFAGLFVALVIGYATFFEFTLQDGMITYRNRYLEDSIPLAWVRKVGMRTSWAGLPGHTFMFLMRKPPAPRDGYFRRTGLVSWPSVTRWVDAVNAEIQRGETSRQH